MVNIPSDPTTLCVNAEKLVLQVGSGGSSVYTTLQDLRFNLERPEIREPVTGLGTDNIITAVYFFGPGDNWLEGTLLMSNAEYSTLATTDFTRDGNGKLTTLLVTLVATNFSGGTATFTNNSNTGFKAVVVRSTVDKPIIGGVKVRLRLRLLEDHITINLAGSN